MKRCLDVVVSVAVLALASWLILLAWVAACVDTRRNGLFTQDRIGMDGRVFRVYKLRTMRDVPGVSSTVTTRSDPRVTSLGRVIRRARVDELPQFFNVLIGDMSVVGPRPDVPGFADALTGSDREILAVRPGITGPASLKYRDEASLLDGQDDPERYNREVIWPDKVAINLEYIRSWSVMLDLKYIWLTVR